MIPEDKRMQQLQEQLPSGYELPVIGGYQLTNHAALRMVVRQIEIDWVRDALTEPGRPGTVDGTQKHCGEMAMCVVDEVAKAIVTVGFGKLNGGIE